MPAEPFLSVDEVARRLAVTPGTVRRWIAEGVLGSVKLGRTRRVRPDQLSAFVASGERRPA